MKLRLAGILVCMVAAAACFHLGSRAEVKPLAPAGIAVVSISPNGFDFGSTDPRTDLATQFQVTNRHTQAVMIQGVSKGCSCSSATLGKMSLEAGESTTLDVTWDVPAKRGKATEFISLTCAHPVGRSFVVGMRIRADVQPEVVCDPDAITFRARSPVAQTVSLRARSGRPVRVREVSSNHPSVSVRWVPDRQIVAIDFDPSVPGWQAGRLAVTIRTDSEHDRGFQLPVTVAD